MGAFRIRVEKDHTGFSAGHFITYDGHLCEPLHGHNYRVAVSIEGPVDENFYVLDFTRAKRLLRAIVDKLDHRMLLPTGSERIVVEEQGDQVVAAYKDKRYVFPATDVVLLPIPNTTAEMLAQWIAGQLQKALGAPALARLEVIEIEVEESLGQRAVFREEHPGRHG
jgi:6-pyruvoyltetrahydropterin/6-carboxytetrahydropterin synthase